MIKLINCPSMPATKNIKTFAAPAGSKTKPVYKYVYDEKYGCPRRVISGEMNLHEYIQQSANDVDFKALGKMLVDTRNNVITHFDIDGDTLDVTKLPRNVNEYEALYNRISEEFNKLPDDMKALFGNDVNQFRTSWLNGSIGNILNAHYQSINNNQPNTKVEEGDNK